MAKKFYVLRGGAILSRHEAWFHFGNPGDEIIVPNAIVHKMHTFNGAKALYASDFDAYVRSLDLSEVMKKGIFQPNGTIFKVLSAGKIDDKIKNLRSVKKDSTAAETLQICLDLQKNLSGDTSTSIIKKVSQNVYDSVILVSGNTGLLLDATKLGIKTEVVNDHLFPIPSQQYTGKREVQVNPSIVNVLKNSGQVVIKDVFGPDRREFTELKENQFVEINSSSYAYYYHGLLKPISLIRTKDFSPRNFEQFCLAAALYMEPEKAPLVIASGVAGTGKSYLSIHAALDQLGEKYEKIVIATPTVGGAVSGVEKESYGYLPGDIFDKVSPFLGGIMDNIVSHIMAGEKSTSMKDLQQARSEAEETARSYFSTGLVEIQPLAYIAGHSFEKCFIILDEAQNVAPQYFLDIITRVGKGSKLVILGDPDQVKVDNLSRRMNGIIYLMEMFKDDDLTFQIKMNPLKSERSDICQRAIKLLS